MLYMFEEQRVIYILTYYTYLLLILYLHTSTYIQFEEQRVGWFQEGEAPSLASAPGLNDHLLNLT